MSDPRPDPWAADTPRGEILQRFEQWLDGVAAPEAPPPGLAADVLAAVQGGIDPQGGDRYPMSSGMTALAQEMKLQARTVHQLKEALSPLDRHVETLLAGQEQALDAMRRTADELAADREQQIREARKEAEERVREQCLEALLDVRDRLQRGLLTAQGRPPALALPPPTRWLDRILGRRPEPALAAPDPTLVALMEGYRLSLARLDERLREMGVEEIACQTFDATCMNAVAAQDSSTDAEGTVLEVVRPGYRLGGEVYRQAEVKVARRPHSMVTGGTNR
ncbi:MAG: nucleotide exchange factor GrpE [Candidatus Xenobia bacterium]